MKKSAVVKLLILSLSVLLLAGCLTNPITGRVGPSWTVPIGIPIATNTVTLEDIIKDQEIETQDDYFVFHFQEEHSIRLVDFIQFAPRVRVTPEIPGEIVGDKLQVEVGINELNLDDLGAFETMSFNQGTLEVNFPNNPGWVTESILIDQQNVAHNNLSGISFNKDSTIKITARTDEAAVIPNEIKFIIKDAELADFHGQFDPVTIAADELDLEVDLGLDLPEIAEQIFAGLEWIDLSLALVLNNPTGLPVNIDDLAIQFQGDGKTVDLAFADAIKSTEGTATRYLFKPKRNDPNDPIISVLRSIPQNLSLEGSLVVGDGSRVNAQLKDLDVSFELDVTSSFTINVSKVEPVIVGPMEIKANESFSETMEEFTENAVLHGKVFNNLPVAVSLDLQVGKDLNKWDEATTIRMGTINAGGNESKLDLPIDQSLKEVLTTGGYSKVVVSLLGEGSQEYNITTKDDVKFSIWAEVEAKINK